MVKYTEFKSGGHLLGYELREDGYGIYFGDNLVIVQDSPYIAHQNCPLEVSAILQIKDICGIPYDLDEEIKKAQPLSPWEQTQLDTALNLEYLICLQEGKV
ncbi:hypothetical protein [Anaerotignum sp.]|uniref:hypothetical protein n=1 Tax=Anaerotignum sp. TaxID=2039241 RepID=UPI0028AFB0BB|nr:hypothetical protein [Anaerotignum sp.]